MNILLSKLFSVINILIGIGIVSVSFFYGLYGPALTSALINAFSTYDFDMVEDVLSSPSLKGGLIGLGLGMLYAAFVCGFFATILLIRKKLAKVDKNLERLYSVIKKNNKSDIEELTHILKSIDSKVVNRPLKQTDSQKSSIINNE
jgi:hypothetical protein